MLQTRRVSTWEWTNSLYHLAQLTVQEAGADALVVAIDPVQFEKPSARRVDGVRKGDKRTPPDLERQARLTLLKARRTWQVRRAS